MKAKRNIIVAIVSCSFGRGGENDCSDTAEGLVAGGL